MMSRSSSSSSSSRRQQRRLRKNLDRAASRKSQTAATSMDDDDLRGDDDRTEDEDDAERVVKKLPPYPPGKPWRVLFFRPHGDLTTLETEGTEKSSTTGGIFLIRWWRKIPSTEQWRTAYRKYMETWEGGIRGTSSPSSSSPPSSDNDDDVNGIKNKNWKASKDHNNGDRNSGISTETVNAISDNASRNMKLVRQDAQYLLQATKDQTGVHTMEDMKVIATEMMKLATDCIKEFMAGYRQGRDDEIDKMLNEYFQEQENDDEGETLNETDTTRKRSKKRRRKRLQHDKYT